jgi:glutathione S-transferase
VPRGRLGDMTDLYHYPLCPHSRFIRLVLGELGIEPRLIEEQAFDRREDFLLMNPAGQTPVLVEDGMPPVPGWGPIGEYLDETRGLALGDHRLLPEPLAPRVEVRRLLDWFNIKFFHEVSSHLVTEKVYKRFMSHEQGGGAPDMDVVRVARANIRYHMRYIGYLIRSRNWLGGPNLTYADLAAAAHLSSIDFLGDVPWAEDETAKAWYARIKSRPSFRPLLADRLRGITPSPSYADLDF